MTAIFPALPGIGIAVKRTPVWSTLVQTSISGKETRAAFQSTPRYRYELPLNFARQYGFSAQTVYDELNTILAFYQTLQGMWDSFWFPDPVVQNLMPNGTSEQPNPTGFAAAGLVAGNAYQGANCRTTVASTVIRVTNKIPVTPGDTIYFECYLTAGPSGTALLYSYGYDAFGVGLGNLNTCSNATTAYMKSGVILTVPAGVYFVDFFIYQDAGSGNSYFDNLFACRMATAGLVAAPDGVITQVAASADGLNMQFQRQCRFDMDEFEFEQIVSQVWGNSKIKLLSLK